MTDRNVSTLPDQNRAAGFPEVVVPVDAPRPWARVGSVVSWTTKGGLAVLDQALFAGAHFILNVLLARWLSPAEYGVFALVYSVFLLVAALYGALLLDPMAVFGSGKYLPVRRSYLGILLRGHVAVTLSAALMLVAIAVVVGRLYSANVERALMALALALPLMLLMWVTRRAFYIDLRPGWVTAADAVYFALLLAMVVWLFHTGRLTPVTAILALGAASLVAGTMQLARLRPSWLPLREEISSAAVAQAHWQYGRWMLASAAISWASENIYYLVLPLWLGLEGSGALRALMNLASPVLHSLVALGMLLTPLLVRHRDRGGIELMRRTVRRLVGLFLLGSAGYLVVLWVFRVEILQFLYGGKYLEYSAAPILLVGALPLLVSVRTVVGGALRALERSDRIFLSCLVAAASIVVGVPLAAVWGIPGALVGLLMSHLLCGAVMFLFLRRLGPGQARALGRPAPQGGGL